MKAFTRKILDRKSTERIAYKNTKLSVSTTSIRVNKKWKISADFSPSTSNSMIFLHHVRFFVQFSFFLSLLAHHSLTHSIFYIFLSDTFSIVCLIQRSDCSYNFIIIEATGACKVKAFCLDWHTHKEYRRNNTLIWGEIWEGERASIKYTQTELRGFSIFSPSHNFPTSSSWRQFCGRRLRQSLKLHCTLLLPSSHHHSLKPPLTFDVESLREKFA